MIKIIKLSINRLIDMKKIILKDRITLKRLWVDSLLIISGSIIMGIGYALFLIPFHLVPGGLSGISIMINYLLPLPVGLVIIILNIPILLISYRFLSRKYVFTTLVGMLCSSVFIDFFNEILKWPKGTDNILLAAIYGGLLLGLGLGLVFRGEASTGGSDVIGLILNKYLGVSVGMGIMVTDFIIISASGLVFRQLEAPLYGYIVLFISSRVIDLVLQGWNFSKMVIITSSQPEKIADFILHQLERSGSALKSRSLYLNREGEIIITVIHRKQLAELKAFIKKTDPGAFVIVNDTYEVLGKGFKTNQAI
ncbi:MAG TPA: YitT family protein [Candidatus Saccharicenans sp.]|nr:YitT family protein [Candidatus Saccharicenans sp.]HUM79309.1 YitT family protein [Candidatus Saccharicenans sp.]